MVTRVLFGMRVIRVSTLPGARLLEIGIGYGAVLSGSLSRLVDLPIDAIDLDEKLVESSERHVELNGVQVNAFQSDLFENVSHTHYDIIFWNLPYYRDPDDYLRRLLLTASDYLSPNGTILLGYNSSPLPEETVERMVRESPGLSLREFRTYGWNLHQIAIIGHALDPGAAPS
jgi:16S rRNA G1207 methylase RsmC